MPPIMEGQGYEEINHRALPPELQGLSDEQLAEVIMDVGEGGISNEFHEDGDEEQEEEDDDEDDESGESSYESGEGEDDGEGEEYDDDEEEEGEEGEEDGDEEEGISSEDDTIEKCPICLLKFFEQDIGTPESCDHMFCFECIQEWSKNVTTCPVDRSFFTSILVRHSVDGEVVRTVKVERRRPEDVNEDDLTFCEMCGRSDREDRLLLCDSCDAGYHCECLDPPLEMIPVEEWYCPRCAPEHQNAPEPTSEEEDYFSSLRRSQRSIPRTRISERVIRVVEQERRRREMELGIQGPSSTSSTAQRSTTRRKTTRKRKTKRKTTKKKKVPTATLR